MRFFLFFLSILACEKKKKFQPGTVEEVEQILRAAKAEEPNRIPYFICRRGSPGYVNLMYLPTNT